MCTRTCACLIEVFLLRYQQGTQDATAQAAIIGCRAQLRRDDSSTSRWCIGVGRPDTGQLLIACPNDHAGYGNVTAAEKAAAASALGISVPAWRPGQRPQFNQAPNGSTYQAQSYVRARAWPW